MRRFDDAVVTEWRVEAFALLDEELCILATSGQSTDEKEDDQSNGEENEYKDNRIISEIASDCVSLWL
jgi:hypothetical protein